jgi:hypothetical protein
MIVKVPPGRRDKKSSFKKLADYLSQGLDQSEESSLKTSWDYLTQYITREDAVGDLNEGNANGEKTIAVEIGNLESLKTAPHEMRAVASRNLRQKNPVYHYILSWPEKEWPNSQAIFGAARHTLKALGMQDHQYIVAIHSDTDNLHAHIEVNRIHPKTYKAARLEWAHATLHKAARECEMMYGWSHDDGIYKVIEKDGKKQIVRDRAYLNKEEVVHSRANRYETWTGEQSLESWCRGKPSEDLENLLNHPKTSSWHEVHCVLARFGLELKESGGNGMKIVDVSGDDHNKQNKPLAVSASKAFRFMKRKELEKRFGQFEARQENLNTVPVQKTYKRDPQKRMDRRLARKALRDALYDRYRSEIAEIRIRRELAMQEIKNQFQQEDKKRLKEVDASYNKIRRDIRANVALSSVQKQQAYMLAKLTVTQKREDLKSLIKSERVARRALLPAITSWRAWVEEQVQLGDEAAISALRGMIYQDKRNSKKELVSEVSNEEEKRISPIGMEDSDPYIRAIQNIVWKVAKNGRIHYSFKNGEAGFIDDGHQLVFGRQEVSDEALRVTLRYASEKWRKPLKITGGDTVFKDRVLRMATEMGIEIGHATLKTEHNLNEQGLHISRTGKIKGRRSGKGALSL